MNKNLLIAGAVVLVSAAGFAFVRMNGPSSDVVTAVAEQYQEGVHYRTVDNAAAPEGRKIQVQEFFWYGCPHCENFEPAIKQYQQTLPEDAELVQIPVTWNDAASLHAAVYYHAVDLKAPDALHAELFRLFIDLRREGNLNKHIDEAQRAFESQGLDTTDFTERLKSAEIRNKVDAATKLLKASAIGGTPSLMVDNTWVVENNEEVGQAGVFKVVDFLIAKARAARQ